ncbi:MULTISPECIES: DNA repair protein RecN [Persephonella]|uniref:DNA repair protein RecN n=1 Tax=Persephonella marina (strain DSM 14350 / EX-H1) TaxID=123214 RepID=C0QPR6_PERMH|nr:MULTISPECIES: DNA repair protein RecN [Persephonella]ACO03336.1 DNA repair protein RecN [Persephonella marina EX-H1]
MPEIKKCNKFYKMLTQINIKKFLYMEDISIDLDEGLNVFTGETGVGKSLIIDAVEFVLGKKGNFSDGSYVELVFENVDNQYSEDGTLIISREIKGGRSAYYINGRRSTLSTVKEASEGVVEIHGQHQQQKLLHKEYHRYILDRYAGILDVLEKYQKVYRRYTELRKKEEKLLEEQSNRIKELDILRYQLQELEEADIKEGEKKDLEEKYSYISRIQEIHQNISRSLMNISEEENSILDKLDQVIKDIGKISDTHRELKNILENLEEARILLKESSYSLLDFDLDIDRSEMVRIQERLDLINRLEMKYNTDEKGLIILKEKLKKRIEYLENLEFEIPEVTKEKEKAYKELKELAEEISAIRKKKGRELEEKVRKHLTDLALKDATFIVDIKEKELDRTGKDDISFLFSGNKDIPPSPLGEAASGGEISRVSLALKVVAGSDTDCMIFDEIDTGIGGKTAILMADKLKKLSENYQVVLVTHLPQVAVRADKHFYIDKFSENGKTRAVVKEVSGEERKMEIARMLSGVINSKSLQLADELLADVVR